MKKQRSWVFSRYPPNCINHEVERIDEDMAFDSSNKFETYDEHQD